MIGPSGMTAPRSAEKQYRELLEQGRFCLQKCAACGLWVFYPRMCCTRCGSQDLAFEDADPKGIVYSCTTVYRPNALDKDYNISIVELNVGCRILSRVEAVAPERVEIGMPVSAIIKSENGRPLLVFEPSHASA